jgi:hypothetical protein
MKYFEKDFEIIISTSSGMVRLIKNDILDSIRPILINSQNGIGLILLQ